MYVHSPVEYDTILLRRRVQVALTSHNRKTTAAQAQALDERCTESTSFVVAHEKECERRVRAHKRQRRAERDFFWFHSTWGGMGMGNEIFFKRESERFDFARKRDFFFGVFPRLFGGFCAFGGVFFCFLGFSFVFSRVSAKKKLVFFGGGIGKTGNSRSDDVSSLRVIVWGGSTRAKKEESGGGQRDEVYMRARAIETLLLWSVLSEKHQPSSHPPATPRGPGVGPL